MDRVDVIVVGGGHNGLTCGAYLARAGLRVAVVEGREAAGGGTRTEEVSIPGFRHNTCSNFFIGFDASPVFQDLELKKHGFHFLVPDVQQAFVFGDGKALVVHQDLEATAAAVARLSPADATTWRDLHKRLAPARPLFVSLLYNPPAAAAGLSANAVSEGIIPGDLAAELQSVRPMRPFDAIDQYFKHERIRVIFKKLIHVIQGTNSPGFGTMFLGLFLNLTRMCLPVGGSGAFVAALARVITEHGGHLLAGRRVTRIVLDGNRAAGVELEGGDVLEADEAVVAAIDFPQLIGLVGEDRLPAGIVDKARAWDWTGAHSLVTLHLALREPPSYRATEWDPAVARAFNISFGVNDSEELRRSMEEVERGSFPSLPAGNGSCNSVFDPSYAPPSGHVAFWWPFAPYRVDGAAENWDRRRDEYAERLLTCWRKYAPNLAHSVVGMHLHTPLDVERGNPSMRYGSVRMGPYTADQFGVNRPHPEMADYRVPGIEMLYHCGSTSPNGGGVNGAPGYCAAGVIVDDLGVDRWWPRMTVARARELTRAR